MHKDRVSAHPLQIKSFSSVGGFVQIVKAGVYGDDLIFEKRVDHVLIRLKKCFAFFIYISEYGLGVNVFAHVIHMDHKHAGVDIIAVQTQIKAHSVECLYDAACMPCPGKDHISEFHIIDQFHGIQHGDIGIKIQNPVHLWRQIFKQQQPVIRFLGDALCEMRALKQPIGNLDRVQLYSAAVHAVLDICKIRKRERTVGYINIKVLSV